MNASLPLLAISAVAISIFCCCCCCRQYRALRIMPHMRCGTDACHFKFKCHISARILFKHMCERQGKKCFKNNKNNQKQGSYVITKTFAKSNTQPCMQIICTHVLYACYVASCRFAYFKLATVKLVGSCGSHILQTLTNALSSCWRTVKELFDVSWKFIYKPQNDLRCIAAFYGVRQCFLLPRRHALAANAFLWLLLQQLFLTERTANWRTQKTVTTTK